VLIEPEKAPLSSLPIPQKVYDTPIEELDLSVRAYNCLKRSNITKVGQVLSMNEEDLLGVRNFGEKSLQELRERLLVRNFLPNPRTSAVGADTDGDHEMED
jgi:DNA-directed RNA polymerase subunit alpha